MLDAILSLFNRRAVRILNHKIAMPGTPDVPASPSWPALRDDKKARRDAAAKLAPSHRAGSKWANRGDFLAYAFLRGKPYRKVETSPAWVTFDKYSRQYWARRLATNAAMEMKRAGIVTYDEANGWQTKDSLLIQDIIAWLMTDHQTEFEHDHQRLSYYAKYEHKKLFEIILNDKLSFDERKRAMRYARGSRDGHRVLVNLSRKLYLPGGSNRDGLGNEIADAAFEMLCSARPMPQGGFVARWLYEFANDDDHDDLWRPKLRALRALALAMSQHRKSKR